MAKGKILIVEDQPVVSQNIKLMLKYNGYEVAGVAPTADEAIKMIGDEKPDLIVMDIALPGKLDGIDATNIITEKWNIPIIYLTAHSDETTLQRAKNTHNYGFIIKDIDLKSQIPIFIEFALYKHRLIEEQQIAARDLAENEEKFRVIVNSARDGIIFIDESGLVSFWNNSSLEKFGFKEIPNDNVFFWQIISIPKVKIYQEKFANIGQLIDNGFIGRLIEFIAIKKDNTTFPVEIVFYPIRVKNRWYTCCIIRDITVRKEAEDEMSKLIEELRVSREMVEQNANELLLANERLYESEENLRILNASKDRFFSILAHDLRGPFQGLLGFSKILHNDFKNLKTEETQDIIEDLYHSAEQIYKLLDHLLLWSRIQRGVLEYKPENCNIRNIVSVNIDLLRSLAGRKNIELLSEINEEFEFISDPNMINTVLRNLISNAIKFTGGGGKIRISANKTKDGYLLVSVKDNGIGILEEDLQKLFKIDTYFTSPGTSGEKGTGLGLVLCKDLIEKCKGKIHVESQVDKGSTFSFLIPINN
ncbi:MAG: response regulator [Ignavibacteriae bacterium]|nr:response regulator [Ignavibacteriota bacterium]